MQRRHVLLGSTTVLMGVAGCLGFGQFDENGDSEVFGPQESGSVEVTNAASEPRHIKVTVSPIDREEEPPNFVASATIAPDEKIRAEGVVSRPGVYRIEAETDDEAVTRDWDVEELERHGAGLARIAVDNDDGLEASIVTFSDNS